MGPEADLNHDFLDPYAPVPLVRGRGFFCLLAAKIEPRAGGVFRSARRDGVAGFPERRPIRDKFTKRRLCGKKVVAGSGALDYCRAVKRRHAWREQMSLRAGRWAAGDEHGRDLRYYREDP